MTSYQYLVFIIFLIPFCGFSQGVPVPADSQSNPILLTGATIHVGNGQVLENSDLLFANGTIQDVGQQIDSPENATVLDVTGKHIYPGLIAANTTLGLIEIGAVRATRDADETGQLNPNVRSIVAYNTDSKVIPTVRSNGILLSQIAPRGGRISGTSSIVQLDAWNWEDAAYKTDDALYLNWPVAVEYSGWWAQPGSFETVEEYNEHVQEITDYFSEAKAYAERENPEQINLRFEGMEGLFTNDKQLFIRVNRAKEIIAAVGFATQFGIKPVIVGGAESYMITDFLKEHDVSVVLDAVHRTPTFGDEFVNLPYEVPARLQEANIPFCLSYADYWQVRNLPFQAGTAIAHGLTKEQGLRSVTLSVAEILGIDDTVGSLEVDKDATLLVTEGDLFDMRTSHVLLAFIKGRNINLGNKQKDLYRKFSNKYGHPVVIDSKYN